MQAKKIELEQLRIEDSRLTKESYDLLKTRPSSLKKRFGANPTPEQVARYKADTKDWNRQWRKNQKEGKENREQSNKLFRELNG